MGAGHSAEGEGGAYASDPPTRHRRKSHSKRRRHSVDSVASYSSQNHVDRIRTQNFSTASCQDDCEFGSIKTSLFRRSSSNLESTQKRPESVTSNTSSTRSRLRELVERKSSQDEHKSAANTVGDIQYFENPTETLEFDQRRHSLESKKSPKKRKLSKGKEKDVTGENKNKKHEKYKSKLAEYYKLPVQLPQDEFYQHLTRSKAAEELIQKRFSNSDTEFSGSYGRLCKHKPEPEGANLRRSRSLAVIREETFTDLQIQNHAKSKRSQLIPRARLFDKPNFKDRLSGRAKYQTKEEVLESIYIDSTASCFGDINAQIIENENPEKTDNRSENAEVISRSDSRHCQSVGGSWSNLNEELKLANLSEDSIGHSRNPSEIDSLDSNYVRKHYNFEAHRNNYKDSSPETDRSIASPNLSKELYGSTDEQSTDNDDKERSKSNTLKSFTNDSLSRSLKEKSIEAEAVKSAEDKDQISIKSKHENQDSPEPQFESNPEEPKIDNDIQSIASENDEIVSSPPDSITSYISISIASSDKSHKLECLANSLAEKIDEYCDFQLQENSSVTSQTIHSENNNHENDPIYTIVNKQKIVTNIQRDPSLKNNNRLFNEILKHQNNELYVSTTYAESDTYSTKSHGYTKNIISETYVTSALENQYCSLPDINISKCLRKSERIDAQLREEDPEDIPCENTFEIAQTHFHEILSSKGRYDQVNKTYVKPSIKIPFNNCLSLPEYSEPQLLQNFTKLEDDLKSTTTIDSSNADVKDSKYYQLDNHQNEREINEIEGTIRNNKIITKSESLKISNSIYRPEVIKSLSNSNINKALQNKKPKFGIRKHYSLRQRDPTEEDTLRIPSPETVEKHTAKLNDTTLKLQATAEAKTHSLLSRVESFKTSAESNIAIVPLSGHQTIVIDPPLHQKERENNCEITIKQKVKPNTTETIPNAESKAQLEPLIETISAKETKKTTPEHPINISSQCTPKDPFKTIKLNKVVKTTVPKLKKETSDKVALVQNSFKKPPVKLIIKDNNKNQINTPVSTSTKVNANMTRPQVLQVIDSKNKKQSPLKMENNIHSDTTNLKHKHDSSDIKEENKQIKSDNTVKEKLSNAIKTDIEYQEKINSVKNYWSKLVDKNPEYKELKQKQEELKDKQEDLSNNNDIHKEIEQNKEENTNKSKCLSEISVGNIIKSLESVKIVDSIRKISQTKLQLWKDETEKVKSDSEIEESTLHKIVKDSSPILYDKNEVKKSGLDSCRDTPEIEIVELSCDDDQNQKTQATLIKAKGYEKGCDDFDHVRYKVMKSELFKNSMIANYRKEAQFDGLLQYLQDYSFQELLVNNNIVIIEPVRTKVEPAPRKNTDTCKIPPTLLKKNDNNCQSDKPKNSVRRHFFYHPIRVNKEIIEEELPNPDTVKKVRNLFEDTLKMKSPVTHDPPLIEENVGLTRRARSYRNLSEESKGNKNGRKKVIRQLTIDTNFGNKKWDNASLSSGVSSGDLSSNNEYENDTLSPYSQKNLKDTVYSSSDEYLCESMNQDFCCESQYVSPDILKKIRECGTSVTYYGGKVMNSRIGSTVSPMTKAIMEEIKSLQKNCSRDCYSCQTKCKGDKCSCLIADKHKQMPSEKQSLIISSETQSNETQDKNNRTEAFPGFKFRLVKSNSCSSRLELTGTAESKNPRIKYTKQTSKEDPPLVHDDENSVRNKICRLESYSKGIVKTPFENKDNEIMNKNSENIKIVPIKKIEPNTKKVDCPQQPTSTTEIKREFILEQTEECAENHKIGTQTEKQDTSPHTFEKKFYYVNDNTDHKKVTPGKFGEMVFEEFEVLESCYDSLNSNKSLK